MISNKLKPILQLNLAVLCMATSGALARYIELPLAVTIASRAVLGSFFIFIFCRFKGFKLGVEKKDVPWFVLSGLLLGLHWLTYFHALRLSNVAIGMISMYTFPVITSFIEPLVFRTKLQKTQLVLGGLALLGVYFLVPEFSFQNEYAQAIALGVFSALLYSLRNIFTKSKTEQYNGSVVMMYQLVVVGLVLLPSFFLYPDLNYVAQLPASLVLAFLTTAVGHTLFLYSLRNFSVTSASLMSSIQPIYGILIGVVFLREFPDWSSMVGGVLIITSVILESTRNYTKK